MLHFKKLFKFIIIFALFVGISIYFTNTVKVSADDTQETITNVIGVYTYSEEGAGNATFTLYSNNTFIGVAYDASSDTTLENKGTYILEGNILTLSTENGVILKCTINGSSLAPYEEPDVLPENTSTPVDLFINHLKDLKWDEAETIFGLIIAYIVAHAGVIIGLVAKLIYDYYKNFKNSKAHAIVVETLEATHQQHILELESKYEQKMVEILDTVKEMSARSQEALDKATNDSTKEIAQELKQVAGLLTK